MVEKSTRDDIATLINMVRGRLISVLVVVIVALGIVSELLSIYNGYLQVEINEAELPKRRAEACSARQKARIDFMPGAAEDRPETDEFRQLDLECSPWARARARARKEKEAGPPVELSARQRIERSACYQRLREAFPKESDEEVTKNALQVCSDLADLKEPLAGSQPKN